MDAAAIKQSRAALCEAAEADTYGPCQSGPNWFVDASRSLLKMLSAFVCKKVANRESGAAPCSFPRFRANTPLNCAAVVSGFAEVGSTRMPSEFDSFDMPASAIFDASVK